MEGEAVPLVLVPRYTSYVGSGEFTTNPLDVSPYSKATVTLWRGALLRSWDPTYPRTFSAVFQGSHDTDSWEDLTSPETDPDTVSNHDIDLPWRWFRISVTLTDGGDPDEHTVGITCWAAGLLVRRIPGAGR